jgi:hypothetical protein
LIAFAIGEIIVAGGQSERTMDVIRQDYPSIDVKRPLSPSTRYRFTQSLDVAHQQIGTTFQQIEGEEIRASWHAVSAVVRHDAMLPSPFIRRNYAGLPL